MGCYILPCRCYSGYLDQTLRKLHICAASQVVRISHRFLGFVTWSFHISPVLVGANIPERYLLVKQSLLLVSVYLSRLIFLSSQYDSALWSTVLLARGQHGTGVSLVEWEPGPTSGNEWRYLF
jgi:hypothetical protein